MSLSIAFGLIYRGQEIAVIRWAESVTSCAETIPYVDEWTMIERAATPSSVSTITIEDENAIATDRPEAPFTQEILMEEVSNEEMDFPCSFGVKLPEIKVRFGSINALLLKS